MSRHPELKWAQRSDKLYLTVELPDAKNPQVKIDPKGKFEFSATVGPENVLYELDLHLYDKVNAEESKVSVGLRNVSCVIVKKENGWWKRLLHGAGKTPPYLKADWDKWVDEDEENEIPSNNADNFDMGSMNNFSEFNIGGDGDGLDNDDDDDADAAAADDEEIDTSSEEKTDENLSSMHNVEAESSGQS